MFNRIMVAFDDSEHAHRALATGIEMAVAHNSDLHLITVVQLPDYAGTVDEVDERIIEGKKFYQEAITRAVAEAGKKGIKVTSGILYGHVGQTLVKYANDHNIDLIVTGSRGRSGVEKLLLGSVSDYISRHARCPVLIVRH